MWIGGVLAVALASFVMAPKATAAERITIYAASSMQEAMRDIARAFRTRNAGVEIEFSFAGTSTLRAQIEHGAPADVFISADIWHAAALHRDGRCSAPTRFATNRMVVITRRGWIVPPASLGIAQNLRSGLGGAPGGGDAPPGGAGTVLDRTHRGRVRNVLHSLTRAGTRVVLADTMVPAGRYTERAIAHMAVDPVLGSAFRTALSANVVSRETNVRAVLAKVMIGEADAGFVYATDVRTASRPVGVTMLPTDWNAEAEYAAAVVTDSKHARAAAAFVEFLGSDFARSVLKRHGFGW